MKRNIYFTIFFILITFSGFAQQTYTIEGVTIELKTEVEGEIDLLWNIIDGKYRYFARDNQGNIQELVNTKSDDKKFQEQYKALLNDLTQNTITTENLNLTLYDLKEYFKKYNASVSSTEYSDDKAKISSRLGVFGGLTNKPFVENPENTTVPFFGAEFEVFEAQNLPRHSGVFSFRHSLENDDFEYSATQLSIGYRFRFINQETFNFYGSLKMVTFTASKATVVFEDPDNPGTFFTSEEKNSFLDVPFIFGIGADIKVTSNSFITLTYSEIFAAFIDSHGNFPVDFAIGYKFNL